MSEAAAIALANEFLLTMPGIDIVNELTDETVGAGGCIITHSACVESDLSAIEED